MDSALGCKIARISGYINSLGGSARVGICDLTRDNILTEPSNDSWWNAGHVAVSGRKVGRYKL